MKFAQSANEVALLWSMPTAYEVLASPIWWAGHPHPRPTKLRKWQRFASRTFVDCFVCLSSSQKVCYKGLSIQGLLSLTYSFWLIPLLFLCLASAKRHQNQSNYLKNYYARDACSFHLPIFRKGKTKSWRNASCIAKVFNTAFAKKRRCKTNKTWVLKPKLFGSPICRSL